MIEVLFVVFICIPLAFAPYVIVTLTINHMRERSKRYQATVEQLKRESYEAALSKL